VLRSLLITPDSEPVDPGVYVCAEPLSLGNTFTHRDRRYRTLDVQPPTIDAATWDLTAVWTVEPV
jgi:hypothetical protein